MNLSKKTLRSATGKWIKEMLMKELSAEDRRQLKEEVDRREKKRKKI